MTATSACSATVNGGTGGDGDLEGDDSGNPICGDKPSAACAAACNTAAESNCAGKPNGDTGSDGDTDRDSGSDGVDDCDAFVELGRISVLLEPDDDTDRDEFVELSILIVISVPVGESDRDVEPATIDERFITLIASENAGDAARDNELAAATGCCKLRRAL